MGDELNQVSEVPGFLAEDEPRYHIGLLFFDNFQIADEFIPGGGGRQAQLGKNLLIVEETSHGHICADTVLFAGLQIGAAFPHGGNQTIPPIIHIADIQVFALINEFLFIGGHDIRHFVAGEFNLDDVAGIILIFLFHHDARVLRIEIGNDFIEKIDRLNLSREEVHLGFSEGGDCRQRQGQCQQ